MRRVTKLRVRLLAGVLMVMSVGVVYGESWLLVWERQSRESDYRIAVIDEGGVMVQGQGDAQTADVYQGEGVIGGDARPLIIRRYLEKYKSPLVEYSDLIYELSKTYGFEYYWIPAIGQQESNLCKKVPEGSFNCWGYGIHSKGTLRFDNYEIALKSFAEYLKREYFDKGLNTPELIMTKYCPHSDGSWARGVTQFIEEMEGGDF